MLRVVGPGICHIVQHLLTLQSIAIRHREETYRPKRSLGVNVQALSFTASHVKRQLASYRHCMTYLTLARPEFPKDLSDGAGLYTAPSSRSRFLDPVVIEMRSLRRACISVAVVNPMGTSFMASSSSATIDLDKFPIAYLRSVIWLLWLLRCL